MSRKSRRRNQKILGALAALTGLTLANKGKGMEDSNISVDNTRGGDSSSAIARKIANMKEPKSVYQDPIMRGGSGAVPNIPGRIVSGNTIKPFSDLMPFKKGGRVGCGIAKRGYGKAMKGKKK